MESPVVLEKPPEYHGTERGFPFEDEEGSGAWSELAARHPDIAARLRQRPATATWARKRRPSSQDPTEDFGENFSGFEGFPFDDIPPEFREHFPTHWNRRFGGQRDEAPPHQPQQPQPPQPQNSPPQQSTAATQTEQAPEPEQSEPQQLPTYGLRNTVDLGQKSPADPSLVDAEERAARSMSAPPPDMSSPPPAAPPAPEHASNVRHIPIFVEGRDEPVINKGEHKPTYTQPPQSHPQPQPHPHPHSQPHIDRDHYFTDDVPPSFHHPPNFSRAFGTPFNKGFRQGPQPFTQQKAYPQTAFNRGASPGRAQSPAAQPPPPPPPAAEQFTRVPVQQEAPPAPAPPQAPKPGPNDPITQILAIQTDVLNLMTEVENFTGTKKDKRYIFLDEMLTRNLIKLDNIETDGKENIRLARKEAIRCIQKSIAVLEAKAEKGGGNDVAMKDNASNEAPPADNGEVEMKEDKSDLQTEAQNGDVAIPQADAQPTEPNNESETTPPSQEQTNPSNANPEEHKIDDKPSPKKKVVKKRDKSKDKAPAASEAAKDSNKVEENVEVMQLDNKGKDSSEQVMEVDGAASQ